MYVHLGQDTVVPSAKIVGIFDLETSTLSPATRAYLAESEKAGRVVNVSLEMPKSFVVVKDGRRPERVYITQISSATLKKRTGFLAGLRVSNRREGPK